MVIPAAVANHGKVVIIKFHSGIRYFPHIFVGRFAHEQFAYRRARVGGVNVHAVLVAVKRYYRDFLGVGRLEYAGYVAVGIERHVERAYHVALYVERMNAYLGIHRAGYWILVAVRTGIFGVSGIFGIHPFIKRERELRHGALVVTNPNEHFTVGRKHIRASCGKLFLVHPVGQRVDNLARRAVLGYLAFGIVEKQFNEIEVTATNERNHRAVGRELRLLLWAAFGKRRERLVVHVVYQIFGRKRMAVYLLRLGLD